MSVALQAGCAVVPPDNLAQSDKRSLGRVAVAGARFDPSYRFEALAAGKGEAAATGAAGGALSCAEFLRGSAGTGMAAGFGALLFLVCLPVGAAVGAIYGTSQAASAQQVEEAKAAAQRAIAALELQNETVRAALRYGKELGLDIGELQQAKGPGSADELPSYTEVRDAADSVMEITVLDAHAFTAGERELRISLGMRARVRVLSTRDGKVIDSLTLNYRGGPARTIEEWLAADGQAVKAEFHRASATIAEQAIDEIFLIYHPKAIPEQTSETAERVPPYALRAMEPPIRNKVYWSRMTYGHLERYPLTELQPTFRWEGWPRGFDIAVGNGRGEAREVRYELRIFEGDAVVYERRAIAATQHRVERALEPCRTYRWTVRARFTLNGAPRATEWMGAYDTMAGSAAPWWWRRSSSVPALAAVPPSVIPFYPIVETPSADGKPCPGR